MGSKLITIAIKFTADALRFSRKFNTSVVDAKKGSNSHPREFNIPEIFQICPR